MDRKTQAPPARISFDDPEGELPYDPLFYVFHVISMTVRHRDARMEELLSPLGLNVPRFRALNAIAARGGVTMSELADMAAVDRTTMTRTVDQLVDAGLAKRSVPLHDRRQVALSLTRDGGRCLFQALDAVRGLNGQLLQGPHDAATRDVAHWSRSVLANLVSDPGLLERLLDSAVSPQGD